MNVTIVDYNSGNISSVVNSFQEVAKNKIYLEVTSDIKKIRFSDKLVLPGQGSFKSCVDALNSINGLLETLNEFVINMMVGRGQRTHALEDRNECQKNVKKVSKNMFFDTF